MAKRSTFYKLTVKPVYETKTGFSWGGRDIKITNEDGDIVTRHYFKSAFILIEQIEVDQALVRKEVETKKEQMLANISSEELEVFGMSKRDFQITYTPFRIDNLIFRDEFEISEKEMDVINSFNREKDCVNPEFSLIVEVNGKYILSILTTNDKSPYYVFNRQYEWDQLRRVYIPREICGLSYHEIGDRDLVPLIEELISSIGK